MKQPTETLVERLSARDEDINRDGFSSNAGHIRAGPLRLYLRHKSRRHETGRQTAPESVMSYEWDGAWQGKNAAAL